MAVSVNYDEKRKKYVWRARASINGKQKERSGACKLKREAQDAGNKAYNELVRQEKASIVYDNNLTIKDSIKEWLYEYKHGTISVKTEKIYRGHIKNHIIPHLGNFKVTKLNRITYQKFINKLVEQGYSKKTIRLINAIMCNFLDFMIHEMRMIDYNCASKIKIKTDETNKQEDEKNMFYTDDEIKLIFEYSRKLIKNTRNEVCADFIEVLLYTGLRVSELLAIQEEDYDAKSGTISINKQLSPDHQINNPIFTPLKTEDSYREVILDSRTKKIIQKRLLINKKEKLRLPPNIIQHDFIFSCSGSTIGRSAVRRYIHKICKASGVRYHEKHAIHAFRHTHIKQLVEAGVPQVVIQKRIGHSKNSAITAHYMHTDNKMNELASKNYEKLISDRF
ncbi:site-specific integrase [Listeria aquatica]|uniref:Site-specific integrase n=1 Tax=Listeria aquatica TaxID=1494960 RepID=A0A841ZPN4_9LIST|nr:site-specific integrase [Listeria aquatica]MBC1522446.1 site-specific integrase [Listeria aquatica]